MGPANTAPHASPNNAALKTGPRAALSRRHSLNNDGAIKPIAPVSKPSISVIEKYNPKIRQSWPPNSLSCKAIWISDTRHQPKSSNNFLQRTNTPSAANVSTTIFRDLVGS
jgi:hypothetical protein